MSCLFCVRVCFLFTSLSIRKAFDKLLKGYFLDNSFRFLCNRDCLERRVAKLSFFVG